MKCMTSVTPSDIYLLWHLIISGLFYFLTLRLHIYFYIIMLYHHCYKIYCCNTLFGHLKKQWHPNFSFLCLKWFNDCCLLHIKSWYYLKDVTIWCYWFCLVEAVFETRNCELWLAFMWNWKKLWCLCSSGEHYAAYFWLYFNTHLTCSWKLQRPALYFLGCFHTQFTMSLSCQFNSLTASEAATM